MERGRASPRLIARSFAFQWRKLVKATSAPDRDHGQTQDAPTTRHVELGQELGGCNSSGNEGQRRPVPRQECTFVGVGEPDIRFLLLGRGIVGHASCTGFEPTETAWGDEVLQQFGIANQPIHGLNPEALGL